MNLENTRGADNKMVREISKEEMRKIRTDIIIAIANEMKLDSLQLEMLKAMGQEDPFIRNLIRVYGLA